MMVRWRVVIGAVLLLLAALVAWQWWNSRRVELYGGLKPFMRKLDALRVATAAELARSSKLPEDYEQMENLSQGAQDLFAVFRNDPREGDPRFGALGAELVRQANMLEHDWDAGTREQAEKSFRAFVKACDSCHEQLAPGKVPPISQAKP